MIKKFFTPLLFIFLAQPTFSQLPQVSLAQLATAYTSPIDIKHCGDNRLFIVEQKGVVNILYKDGSKQSTPFLDIDARVNSTGDEEGLLGIAFGPSYKQDGFFYVQYTTDLGADSIVISRFNVMPGDSTQADPNSERILMTYYDPYSNHNGGSLAFGSDGYLYASQGDGGSAGDPQGNGQNLNVFLGKILRIDVSDTAAGYAIPADNPFVGVANTKPEIWAYGLRNPWRCSFDRVTGDYWMADVGQNTYEEIDFQPANDTGGQNYGWKCREGLHAYGGCSTPASEFTEPIAELSHTNGVVSVTGGYVYRGTQYAKLFGKYIFTDYGNGTIYTVTRNGNMFDLDTLNDFTNFQFTSFGEDNLGEIYLAYRGSTANPTGRIYKLVELSGCNPVAFITTDDTLEGCSPVTLTALPGDTLSYQWFNSSGIINGANSNVYTTTESGWYKILVSKTLYPGCEAFSDSVYVNILDTTELFLPKIGTSCVNDPPAPLAGVVTPTGGVYSGAGVLVDTFYSNLANVGINTITYQYTNASGCVSSASFDVMVNFYNNVTKLFTTTTFCNTDVPFYLGDYFMPPGGVISGPAVVNDTFNPLQVLTAADGWVFYTYTNNNGCVTPDSIQLTVNICSGIENVSAEIAFSISPNPSNGHFNINVASEQSSNSELRITDATGKLCYSQKLVLDKVRTTIPLELLLAKGVYALQLRSENSTVVKHLVIE